MNGYFQKNVKQGSKVAIISANTSAGPFTIRLYVNNGETATLQIKKAKSLKNAEKIAGYLVNQW